jgi:hypothetical protein
MAAVMMSLSMVGDLAGFRFKFVEELPSGASL